MAIAKQSKSTEPKARAKVKGVFLMRLALKAGVSLDTARRWAVGDVVNEGNAIRLMKAAEGLGIEVIQ